MEFGSVSGMGKTRFAAYNIVAFSTTLIRTLYYSRSVRTEREAKQGSPGSEGSGLPKTEAKKSRFRTKILLRCCG